VPAAVWSPEGLIFLHDDQEPEFPIKIPQDTKIEYDLDGNGVVANRGPNPVDQGAIRKNHLKKFSNCA
jgi:hypothetical protein